MRKLSYKIIFTLMFLFFTANIFCQNADSTAQKLTKKREYKFLKDGSVELFFHLPYHFLHSNPDLYRMMGKENKSYKNYYNYGFGLLISHNISKAKLSIGIYFSTKNYFRDIGDTYVVDKIYYYNIPLIFSIRFGNFSPFVGYIYNKPFFFNNNNVLQEELKHNTPFPPDRISNSYMVSYNSTFRIGGDYKIKINKYLFLHNNLFFDYRLKNDDVIFFGVPVVEGHFTIGINTSIEYIFSKQNRHAY